MKPKQKHFLIAFFIFFILVIGAMFIQKNAADPMPTDINTAEREKAKHRGKYFEQGLPFKAAFWPHKNPDWTKGTVYGIPAWLDTKNNIIWGPELDIRFKKWNRQSLFDAMEACRRMEPMGSWGLPDLKEMTYAMEHYFYKADPKSQKRWMTYMVNTRLRQIKPAVRTWGTPKDFAGVFIRCIAKKKI